MLLEKYRDERRCAKCHAPAERLVESAFDQGAGKFVEREAPVQTWTGVATHMCSAQCGCLTREQTYHDDLSYECVCVDDPFDARFGR